MLPIIRKYKGIIPSQTVRQGTLIELTSLDADKVTLNKPDVTSYAGMVGIVSHSHFRRGIPYDITVTINRTDCPFTPENGHVVGKVSNNG
jgi:hypothetical protein